MTSESLLRINLGGRLRGESLYDFSPTSDRPIEDILDRIDKNYSSAIIWGGEPTLRKDLPRLISGLSDRGISSISLLTDGAALSQERILSPLVERGLTEIVYRLSALRSDANDWFMGFKGATKSVLKSMRVARQLGLTLSAEITATRPTLPFLEETVEGLCRLGVGKITIRRLQAKGKAADIYASLSPRLSHIQIPLRQAAAAAYRHRSAFHVVGFPCKGIPQVKDTLLMDPQYESNPKCIGIECHPNCQGQPMDYISRFGWHELHSDTPTQKNVVRRIQFHMQESSRRIRKRMVALTMDDVAVLRITGDFRHPFAPQLLKDALRLSIPQLEISGDLRPFLDFSHSHMVMLKQFHRVDACVYGLNPDTHDKFVSEPGAFQKQMDALSRFDGPKKGLVLCLSTVDSLMEAISGSPQYNPDLSLSFRLISPGASLFSLYEMAKKLPPSYAKKIYALLPTCFHSDQSLEMDSHSTDYNWLYAAPHERGPLPGDRLTSFEECPHCNDDNCSGLATGWDASGLFSYNRS